MKWILSALIFLSPMSMYGDFLVPQATLPMVVKTRVLQLSQHNTLVFEDEIDIAKMDMALTAITAKYVALAKDELLYVFIFSPGGSVDVARAASNYLNSMPQLRFVCMDCESAAGWMFENSHTPRLVVQRSIIMMHEIRIFAMTPTVLKSIDPKQFLKAADEFNQIFATRMHIPLEIYAARISDVNWVVKADDMINMGLADEIVDVSCDPFVALLMPNTCAGASE